MHLEMSPTALMQLGGTRLGVWAISLGRKKERDKREKWDMGVFTLTCDVHSLSPTQDCVDS